MKTHRFFDFEVLPHWWLYVSGDYPEDGVITENVKSSFKVISSDTEDARAKVLKDLQENGKVCAGYNIKGYDLIIANGIYQGFSPEQIKLLNDIIINPHVAYKSKEGLRLMPFAKKRLRGVCFEDLMDDCDGSLKEKECVLGMNILESSVDFQEENLDAEKKAELIYYCKQDVFAAMVFYDTVVKPYMKTKLAMGKRFSIPEETCYASTNARLVSIALNAKKTEFHDAEKIEISLPPRIAEYCQKYAPYEAINRLLRSNEGFVIHLFDNEVSYGNGGIHSVYCPDPTKDPPALYVESDDEWCLFNVDASSYYPSLMIQLKLLSRAVEGPQGFIDIFDERINLKHIENPTEEQVAWQKADKLVLNTTFGASGNKWLDLYDPYMCTSVCRVGQIFLTALAFRLTGVVPDLKIIQTNTDGILAYCRKKDLYLVERCMKEWTATSGINMEMDRVEKIWQKDVNDYLMVEEGGKVKKKGNWLQDTYLHPGYVTVGALTGFVSAKAVKDYLLSGKNIVSSILNCTDIRDFAISCKKGKTFHGVVQRFANGEEKELFKCNRVLASKSLDTGMIYKYYQISPGRRLYKKMPNIPEHCKLINFALDEYDFNDIKDDLDYEYYISRAKDMLDIRWKHLAGKDLFETHQFDFQR